LRRLLVLVPFLLLLVAPAFAKLEGAQWTEAEKHFRLLFSRTGEPESKIDAAKKVASDGEPRSFKVISDGLLLQAGHVLKLSDKLSKDLSALQELLGKKLSEMYPADREEMYRLQTAVAVLETQRGEEEKVLRQLVVIVNGGSDGLRAQTLKACRGNAEWLVRSIAGRLAATKPDDPLSRDVLAECLDKEKDPRVRLAALEGLEKAPGTSWHGFVASRALDPEWGVQVVAARIAGEREVGKAIPNLIQSLAKAPPRVSEAAVAALRKLTGLNMEADAGAWGKWWEAHRAEWGEDGRPIAPVVAQPRASDIEFYGLKVKSDRILYVIDISGSMKEEKKVPPPPAPKGGPVTGDDKPAPAAPEKLGGPKIEIAKQELIRSLKKLSKESFFNIIAFNHQVLQWQQKMMQATEANKELAYAWIRDFAPSGSTYIDGALRLGFKMAGMGAYDKAYPGVNVDTIILLSDGAPTDNAFPESKNMEPKEILGHVREWNPEKRIIIHCVGIDNVVTGIQFLRDLARENGGTYVDG